jgi:hypothetical protein
MNSKTMLSNFVEKQSVEWMSINVTFRKVLNILRIKKYYPLILIQYNQFCHVSNFKNNKYINKCIKLNQCVNCT